MSKRNLYDAMREDSRRMQLRPGRSNWRRLENRLDNRSGSRITLWRQLSMVAGVALLIGAIWGLTWMTEPHNELTAMNDRSPGLMVEELVLTDVDRNAIRAVSLSHRVDVTNWQSREEERKGKQLATRVNVKPTLSPSAGVSKKSNTHREMTKSQTDSAPKPEQNASRQLAIDRRDTVAPDASVKVRTAPYQPVKNGSYQSLEGRRFFVTAIVGDMPSYAPALSRPTGIMSLLNIVQYIQDDAAALTVELPATIENRVFYLTENTGNRSVFAAKGDGFPQQAILERKEGSGFSLELSGGTLSDAQLRDLRRVELFPQHDRLFFDLQHY